VQSNACIGAFHPCLPYNHNKGDGSDDDSEQSKQSHLKSTSNDYSYNDLCLETEGKDDRRTVKATVSPFRVKHPTMNSQDSVEDSGNTMLNAAASSQYCEDDKDATFHPSDLPYYKGWTFTQVQDFKFDSQGNHQGIVTPSGISIHV